MLDINDMLVYQKVVELDGFTRAAEALNLPKSNISRKIKRLEQGLGVALLNRSTRCISMTQAGEIYYQHCIRITEELTNAAASMSENKEVAAGTLDICCDLAIGQELLTYYVAEFRHHHPQIAFRLTLSNTKPVYMEPKFDLVISSDKLHTEQIVCHHLQTINRQLYASEDYIAAHPALNALESLTTLDCLSLEHHKVDGHWLLYEEGVCRKVAINPIIVANDYFVLKTMAEQGLGVVLLPEYFVEPSSSNLISVLPKVKAEPIDLFVSYRESQATSPKLSIFIDYLLSELGASG